ncbi:unnamed protein product [Rhizophagus irregularis]|nr:unnamed protein product [Rhizophagus irregularis]CAB5206651.1 unnamed protein product [Rhizophagus irregularis]
MIPNILYTITRGNSSNNNSNNNSNNENSNNNPDSNSNNNNNPNNSNNDDPNNDNNEENEIASRSIHVSNNSHFAQLEQQIASQLREQSRELQQQQQQQVDGQTSINAPTSANQSIFTNNFRLNQPVCILRAPEDSNYPENTNFPSASEIQQSSAMFFPPTYVPPRTGSGSHDHIETANDKNDTSNGVFADKYSLNVIQTEENNNLNLNLFMNRISYNTYTDAYYENGDLSHKYLKNWKKGAYQCDNIEKKIEHDWMKTYLARSPSPDKMNDDGEISWKFDYRNGGYLINSLKVRLSFGTFDNDAKVQWFVKPLPTMKNQDPSWNLIQFEPYTERRHKVNEIKDLTEYVKSEYGFILKANLSGGEQDNVIWQKTQLFRQDWNSKLSRDKLMIENDDTFGFDVKVKLRPDIIVDPLPELSVSNDESNTLKKLNDESTSDFVIHYKVSSGDNTSNERNFYAHSKVLSRRSDYFNALLESKMIESQSKSLTLTDEDITYESLEIILNYVYNGDLPNIKTFNEWTTLLRYASRFLITTLIQRCEKALKGFLNHNNLNEIESIANEYGAEQLLQCCKNFEPPKNN